MFKISKEKLNELYAKISAAMPLYLPLKKAGEVNYGLYEDGCFHVYDMEGKELLRHWPRQNWPHQAGR